MAKKMTGPGEHEEHTSNKSTTIYWNSTLRMLFRPRSIRYGPTQAMTAIVDRYNELVMAEMPRIIGLFDDREMLFMAQLLRPGELLPASVIQGFIAKRLAYRAALPAAQSDGVDIQALAKKVKRMNTLQEYCLYEHLEDIGERARIPQGESEEG